MSKKGPTTRSVSIYDQDETEFGFDSDIGNSYFQTDFHVNDLSRLEIMEYLNWKNEKACQEYQDFGGILSMSPKVFHRTCIRRDDGFAY